MRILHVLSTPRAEGTPNLVLDWMTVAGYEQDVFVLHGYPPDLKAELQAAANWYGQDQLFTRRGLEKFMRIVIAIWRTCRNRRPDVLVCWPGGFSSWVCIGARLALFGNVRLLVHCGNPPSRGRAADWISRFVLWPVWVLRGRCICCSDYVCDLYRSIPALPECLFSTVYNSTRAGTIRARVKQFHDRHSHGENDDRPTAVMVATIEKHKDHETLIKAVPAIVRRLPTFLLLLIGDGSLRSALQQLSRDLGVDSSVHFVGMSRTVPEWLARADVFVLATTRQEGLGSVLLEALAANLPIVATDVPACRELLQDGKWGRLVRPGDSEALADAVLDALQTKTRPDDAAVEKYLDQFSPENMLKGYLGKAFGLEVQDRLAHPSVPRS